MKLTKETLKQIIQEQMEEAITKADTSLSFDETDPNQGLFLIMDEVQEKAMEKLGITDEVLRKQKADFKFSEMSNEVVTGRLEDIDGMAQELIQKFLLEFPKFQKFQMK